MIIDKYLFYFSLPFESSWLFCILYASLDFNFVLSLQLIVFLTKLRNVMKKLDQLFLGKLDREKVPLVILFLGNLISNRRSRSNQLHGIVQAFPKSDLAATLWSLTRLESLIQKKAMTQFKTKFVSVQPLHLQVHMHLFWSLTLLPGIQQKNRDQSNIFLIFLEKTYTNI